MLAYHAQLNSADEEVRLRARERQLGRRHDLRPELVLQAVDEDVVRQRGRTQDARLANERQPDGDEEERKAAGTVLGASGAREGEGDVTNGVTLVHQEKPKS